MQKLLPVIGVVYLGFFVIESVLPGTIVEVFNINILLLIFVADILYLLWGADKNKNDQHKLLVRKHLSFLIFLVALAMIVSALFIVQYKISIAESLLYIAFAILIGKFIKDMFGKGT